MYGLCSEADITYIWVVLVPVWNLETCRVCITIEVIDLACTIGELMKSSACHGSKVVGGHGFG